jgi:glucan phosphorylase
MAKLETNVVARSCVEVKYRAMANGVCEMLWLKRILKELQVSMNMSMKSYWDNKAVISIAQNPVQHDRTKHVEIDRHFIKKFNKKD